jgi:hypothetical protein
MRNLEMKKFVGGSPETQKLEKLWRAERHGSY